MKVWMLKDQSAYSDNYLFLLWWICMSYTISFFCLAVEWILLCGEAILRVDWEQAPTFEILCCLRQAHPYTDTCVGSGICRFLSPLRGSSWACPGAVGWQRQAGELRGTQVTLLEVLQKKAVSAEHFSFDKLLNSMLLFSFLLGSCVYLHIYLRAGRGRNRCFLMFQM